MKKFNEWRNAQNEWSEKDDAWSLVHEYGPEIKAKIKEMMAPIIMRDPIAKNNPHLANTAAAQILLDLSQELDEKARSERMSRGLGPSVSWQPK